MTFDGSIEIRIIRKERSRQDDEGMRRLVEKQRLGVTTASGLKSAEASIPEADDHEGGHNLDLWKRELSSSAQQITPRDSRAHRSALDKREQIRRVDIGQRKIEMSPKERVEIAIRWESGHATQICKFVARWSGKPGV
ncbi:MAG TPA: hypothetical protein VM166_00070 [Gemmatimonadaceae bacterium]|nr:hypothetical protein [Gemmatimonadaceae bacterium]